MGTLKSKYVGFWLFHQFDVGILEKELFWHRCVICLNILGCEQQKCFGNLPKYDFYSLKCVPIESIFMPFLHELYLGKVMTPQFPFADGAGVPVPQIKLFILRSFLQWLPNFLS
jgi:hypothetical protein